MINVEKIKELTGHSGAVYCLANGQSNNSVFSGSADGFVAEWDLEKLEPTKFSIKFNSPVFSLCHISELKLLVVGLFNGHLHIVDLNEKKEIKDFKIPANGIFSIFYHKSKNKIYAGSADGVLNVWDLLTFKHEQSVPVSSQKIRAITRGGNDNEIYIGCGDGNLKIVETENFTELKSIQAHESGLNAILVKYDIYITAGKDARIKFFNKDSHIELKNIPAHNYGIYKIVQWGLRYFVSCSRDKTIKIWNFNNLDTPLRLDFKTFKGHTASVNDLLINVANNYLISCSDDKKIIVWKQI